MLGTLLRKIMEIILVQMVLIGVLLLGRFLIKMLVKLALMGRLLGLNMPKSPFHCWFLLLELILGIMMFVQLLIKMMEIMTLLQL